MKKFIKINCILLGIGFTVVNFYCLKRHYQDLTERKILKDIASRYKGFPIKGTWIQKHDDHYLGGITIEVNGTSHHHQFLADAKGNVALKD